MNKLVLTVILFVMWASAAQGVSWLVNNDASGDAPTIQAGLDSATAGDTVLVGCGVHYECDLTLKSGVVLRGLNGDPACDTIYAAYQGRLFTGANLAPGTAIEGITLANAFVDTSDDLGAALLLDNCTLSIDNCLFAGNISAGMGGAIYAFGNSSLTISNARFLWNASNRDGGTIFVGDDVLLTITESYFESNTTNESGGCIVARDRSQVFVRDSEFESNRAFGASAVRGGGVASFVDSTFGDFQRCTFRHNVGNEGGAFNAKTAGTTVVFRSSLFEENTATFLGGAILSNNATVIADSCTFRLQTARVGNVAIAALGSPVFEFRDCIFDRNSMGTRGRALVRRTSFSGPGGGIGHTSGSISIVDCSLEDGFATIRESDSLLIDSTVFHRVTEVRAHAVQLSRIRNTTNVGATGPGAFRFSAALDTDIFMDNVVAAFASGEAVVCPPSDTANFHIACSNFYANGAGDWTGYCIADQFGMDGNISADPLFCDTSAGDFSVAFGSPNVSTPGCGTIGRFGVGCSPLATDVASPSWPTGTIQLAAFPNPAPGTVSIRYGLGRNAETNVSVYDIRGRLVRTFPVSGGSGVIAWDRLDERGRTVSPGTYFLRTQTGDRILTARMLLLH